MNWIKDLFHELSLVTWPTKKEAYKDFVMVVQYSLFFAVVLLVFDGISKTAITYAVELAKNLIG
jgi:preprotein translocase subunit SecE